MKFLSKESNLEENLCYKNIGNSIGKNIYAGVLLFCFVYSSLVYFLQFIRNDFEFIFIYLTNWTFTLFLFSTTLNFIDLVVNPITLSYSMKRIIFVIGLITKPTYLYVCLFYSFSLITRFIDIGDLNYANGTVKESKDWLFYFNDINKHFIFIILLIILFIFHPRNEQGDFLYKWWEFIYSVLFIFTYLFFALIYYAITNIKIYNVTNIAILLMVSTLPITIFIIFMAFKSIDDRIRQFLFRGSI